MAARVLIVATSHDQLGDSGQPTGCWVEEVAGPFLLWKQHGYQVDIASVKGGAIPWDPASTSGDFFTPEAGAFLKDDVASEAIKNTKSVDDVLAGGVEQYDAVFFPGGHGIVWDGPPSQGVKTLIEKLWAAGKVVSAVCHGPSALVTATGPDGKSILNGKQVTGFTDTEEVAVGKDKVVPFLLEQKLKECGGVFSRGDDWGPYAVTDGKLVTGQNPGSSKRVAELVHEVLSPGVQPQHGKGLEEGFHRRNKPNEEVKHLHDHHDQHPKQGARHDAPNPAAERFSWHMSYRPPI